MKTVGEILQENRNKKGLSLEEVEKATRIRKKILGFLEKGDWVSLPSPTFVKGLIRNYGKFLGLDEKELLAFYRREYDERKDQKKSFTKKQIKNESWFRFTPQTVTISAISLVVLVVVGYLFIQFQNFTGAPLLEIQEPKNNIKINTLEVNLVGKTWEDAILKVNGEKVSVSPGGTFSLPVNLNKGLNTITVTAENRFGKISTQKRTVVVELAQPSTTLPPSATTFSLVVKIGPESALISVEIDGKKDFEGILVAGTEKTFSGNERLRINTKNAGSTKVVFNGVEEILGRSGEEIEKIYTK
jgi:cytoskeletal protein RodZ